MERFKNIKAEFKLSILGASFSIKITFVSFWFFLSLTVNSQNQAKIDSLLNCVSINKTDTTAINCLNELSFLLAKNNSEKALEYGFRAYNLATQLRLKKHIAKSLNNIGNAYMNHSEYDKALNYYNRALKLCEEIQFYKGIGYALSNIGFIYSNKGDNKKALSYYMRALKIKEKIGDKKSIALSLNKLGALFYTQSNYPLALEYFLKALKMDESIDNKQGISNGLNNVALVYYQQKNFKLSLEFNQRALAIDEKLRNKNGVATSLNNIGNIYNGLKDYNKALEYYVKSLKIRESIDDKVGVSGSLGNIGLIYEAMNKVEEALLFYKRSLKASEEIENQYGVSAAAINLAGAYKKLKNNELAFKYAERGYKVAAEIEAIYLQAEASAEASEIAFELKKYKEAYFYHKIYKEMSDSLANEKNIRKLTELELQSKFESEQELNKLQQEKKDIKVKAEIESQRLRQNFLIAAMVLILLLGLMMLRSYRIKQKANTALEKAYHRINEQHKDIKDSINYAKNIQQAILPLDYRITEALKDFFILFKPRDVVSGDFYWFTEKENFIFIAVADCTGHGVPGAFMSMIGSAALTHAVSERGILDTGEILSETNKKIKAALKQSENSNRDGMDIALLRFEKNNLNKIQFASAMRPLYYINEKFNEIQGDKMPIGGLTNDAYAYKTHDLTLLKGNLLYMLSDGYSDQFGGSDGKKFMAKNLKKLFFSIHDKTLPEQKQIIDETFETWKGSLEQVDDICVIGIKI